MGDEVLGFTVTGAYAEYALAVNVAPKPAGLGWESAAALHGPSHQFGPALADYARLAADGRPRVRIDRGLSLADAAKAQELSEAGHPRGKLVLRP